MPPTHDASESIAARTASDRPATNEPVEVLAPPPAGMIAGRVTRIVQLLSLMNAHEFITLEELVKQLNVSRRTIFRDLRVLARAGVPFASTPNGYTLQKGYKAAQLNLGVAEALGLMVLGKIARAIPHQPLFSDALGAIERCMAQIPEHSRQVYEDLVRQVTYAPGSINISDEDERYFCLLQSAIDECNVCVISYNPVGDNVPFRTLIHPLHLHFYKHSWYALAFSVLHNEIRMFKLARINHLEATRQTFEPIAFSIEKHLDGAWGIIPGERKYEVEIEFTPKVARNVAEIRWHASQQTEMRHDGSCVLRFRVNGLDEMSWWVFSYADQAFVRTPLELREKIAQMARRTLERSSQP